MNWWDELWVLFIIIPLFLVWVFALVDLFRREDTSGAEKALWLVAIIFMPLLGTLLYFIFRPVGVTPEERAALRETAAYADQARPRPQRASRAEQLQLLSRLHDAGELSDAEYANEKGRIAGSA